MHATDNPRLQAARAELSEEWQAFGPRTPAEITDFYRRSRNLRADLEAWHATPERQLVTDMIVHVARSAGARHIVDIGCGVGHDLRALKVAGFGGLVGVEPNDALRSGLIGSGIAVAPSLTPEHVAAADLIVCIDVLEHVPDPELFVRMIATNAKVGTWLIESAATEDDSTPLHLKANRTFHPGRTLERHGWWRVDRTDRLRVWERKAEIGGQTQSILACVYRNMSTVTHHGILELLQTNPAWRERVKAGDGLIARSRSIITTSWWTETNDDVFLMLDDDVTFSPEDAERLIQLCRDGHDIVCGAYPVHNGAHFAIKMLPGANNSITFGDGEPIEIRYAATGFMAVHRRVIDALAPTLPTCEPWAFKPFFQAMVAVDEITGDHTLLSEDWGFCEMARQLGFKVWLDPKAILDHESMLPVSVRNMGLVQAAVNAAKPGIVTMEATNGRSD